MSDVASSWERIERWLSAHAPKFVGGLRPPASADALARAEDALGVVLPDDVRASFAIHDGEAQWSPGVIGGYVLCSVADLVRVWRLNCDVPSSESQMRRARPARGVQKSWWDKGWIPIAQDGGAVVVCVDTNPALGGTIGQLVLYISDSPDREIVAPSFEAWIASAAAEYESGSIRVQLDGRGEPSWLLRPDDEDYDEGRETETEDA